MDRFKIHGGKKLNGTVQISGAKNAALPAMAAALLTSDPVTLQNIPRVRDIITMAKLLAHMRCVVGSPDLPPSSALPAMAAALLTSDPVTLQNIPRVRDIITMAKLLAHMRCVVGSPDLPPSE